MLLSVALPAKEEKGNAYGCISHSFHIGRICKLISDKVLHLQGWLLIIDWHI